MKVPPNFIFPSKCWGYPQYVLLTSAFFMMTSSKIRLKCHSLEIRQLLNPLSSESGWPTKLKLVCRPNHQTGLVRYTLKVLVLTSAYLMMTSSKIWQKLKIRQSDVIMSDFHKNFRKWPPGGYLVCVQIWSHLHHLNKSYAIFRFFQFCMGIYRKIEENHTYLRQKLHIFTYRGHRYIKLSGNVQNRIKIKVAKTQAFGLCQFSVICNNITGGINLPPPRVK